MNYNNFVEAVFKLGKKEGFEDMEVYFQKSNEFETMVFKSEVDKYSISESSGLSFRGLYNDKMGYSYTEVLNEDTIKMLVNDAKENAIVIESEDKVIISEKQSGYRELNEFNENLFAISKDKKIEFLKELEKEILKLDGRIKMVNYNLYQESESQLKITNTKGMDLNTKSNIAVVYVSALAVENDENKTGSKLILSRDFDTFNYKEIAKEVVKEAVDLLGAKTVASKNYDIIFRNECAASLVGAFSSVFSAEDVQKNLSIMKGKLNEKVASKLVTLVDNPFLEGGFANASFDAEGTPSQVTEIIKGGILKSFLHNNKTATIDNIKSTGNASKASYKSSINIGPTNMMISKGKKTFDEMIKDLGEGLIITELQGLHAGLNPISGDFSLLALGFLVEDGKIKRPADQFTVAGNLKELLLNIVEVGNDLEFGFPSGSSIIGSPSIRVNGLAIAGE